MRILLILAILLVPFAARADDAAAVSDGDRTEIQRVIASQIDAFRHGDGAGAFGFASPNIQEMFGDATHFMAMVKQGYAPVYNPKAVRFGDLVTVDGRLVQRVDLIGPDGLHARALYTMEKEADGSWKINGCALTKPDDVQT
jgi:ketosteroid isomerase-like protein